MPSKRRHSQRKKLARSKRGKGTPLSPTVIAHQETVVQPAKTVGQPKVSAPSAGMQIRAPAQYPYVVAELRRIGILAGIMLVILVVLSVVLS